MTGLCCACSEPGQPSPACQGQSPTRRSGAGGHIPAKWAGDSHFGIRAPFFIFFHPTAVASLTAAQSHVPSPAQLHLSILLPWLKAGTPKSRARLPALPCGVFHRVHPQPSAFLPTSSLQSRSLQSSAFVQLNRLLFRKPSPLSQHWIYAFPYAFGLQVPVDGS